MKNKVCRNNLFIRHNTKGKMFCTFSYFLYDKTFKLSNISFTHFTSPVSTKTLGSGGEESRFKNKSTTIIHHSSTLKSDPREMQQCRGKKVTCNFFVFLRSLVRQIVLQLAMHTHITTNISPRTSSKHNGGGGWGY